MSEDVLATTTAAELALLASFDPSRLRDSDPVTRQLLDWYVIEARGSGPKRALMLQETARIDALATVLERAGPRGLTELRRSIEPHFGGPLQAMLDGHVDDAPKPIEAQSEDELAASLHVVRWLTSAYARAGLRGGPAVGAREEIEARLRMLSMIRPITELLENGFIGRSRELQRLHDFRRKSAGGGLYQSPAFVIHGIGGMGKSTLVARFIQDVIDEGGNWAYLDFDRATLTPRAATPNAPPTAHSRPQLVLDDLVRQVGAQHPGLAALLTSSRAMVQQSTRSMGLESIGYNEADDVAASDIAQAMDRMLGGGPLVVVLDTFEEVERTGPEAGQELHRLFDRFSSVMPGLRLLVSGRAPAAAFRSGPELELEVGEFDLADAREVLSSFVYGREHQQLIDASTAATVGELVGRSPLTLQLAAKVLAAEGVAAIEDLSRRAATMQRIRNEFVRGFLYHRIIDHVVTSDDAIRDRLKSVARAGLVLRRIDVDALANVLLPALGIAASSDVVARIFAALEREVALVHKLEDGSLIVRRELREPALAALKLDDGALVRRVREQAIAYFERTENRAEVVYHRLAGGEPLATLSIELTPELRTSLESSLADLPGGIAEQLRGFVPLSATDALEAEREQMEWEQRVLSAASSALALAPERFEVARELLAERTQRSPTSELHRLESRIDEAQGDFDGAIESARRDLTASTLAEHPTRIAAAAVRLAKLLEWRDAADEALQILEQTEASPLLVGEWALRLELVLDRMAAAERAGRESEQDRWSWGLRARRSLQQLGASANTNNALVRLLAGVLGREEPRYIREAVSRIGLPPKAPAPRVLALAKALLQWDESLGSSPAQPGPVALATKLRTYDDAYGVESWQAHIGSLGTSAASIFGEDFWALGVPAPVLAALRRFYLHDEFDRPVALEIAKHDAVRNDERLDFNDESTRRLESLIAAKYKIPEDLERLASNVGIDPTELRGIGELSRIVRELLRMAQANDQLDELIAAVLEDTRSPQLNQAIYETVGQQRIEVWGLGNHTSFAARYDRQFVRSLSHHAVWPPLSGPINVGDFGLMRRGVFQRLGNVSEFGAAIEIRTGSSPAFAFASNVTVVRHVAGVVVASFHDIPVDAQLALEFENGPGVYVQSAELAVWELRSLDTLAAQLQEHHGDRRWRSGWAIVGRLYVAHDGIVVASDDKAGLAVHGTAAELRQLEAGHASPAIHVSMRHGNVAHAIGGEGPLMFDLFRLRRFRGVLQPVS